MPFPLAHPAAVLPLRRFSPRWLSVPALITGSVVPDAAYLVGKSSLDELSHTILGLLLFSLPAGLLLTVLWRLLVPWFATPIGRKCRLQFLAESGTARWSIAKTAVSVLIGASTHLLWDGITHHGRIAAELLPFLENAVGSFAGHTVRVSRVLWYVSSFVGIAWVYLAFVKAQRTPVCSIPRVSGATDWFRAGLVSALVVPLELLHDLVRGPIGTLLVAGCSLVLMTVVVWSLARPSPATSPSPGVS
ncbi:MAG TPA: DUF4184 family protein [Verrucomicrobiae bacterium]